MTWQRDVGKWNTDCWKRPRRYCAERHGRVQLLMAAPSTGDSRAGSSQDMACTSFRSSPQSADGAEVRRQDCPATGWSGLGVGNCDERAQTGERLW